MAQSNEEILCLELGAVVRNLWRSAQLEIEDVTGITDAYGRGKIHAYGVVYRALQRVSEFDISEFERKIDERMAAKTLHLDGKPDGKYGIYYVEGRITTEFPCSKE